MFQAIVIGNLGADAQCHNSQGSEFISFRVAHTDRWKDTNGDVKERTTWVDVTMNGKPAVFEFLKRGTAVAVIGSVSLRVYSSPRDRMMKAGAQVAARSIELLGGARDAVPSRLYDENGVQHDVQKFFHTDVASTQLFTPSGQAYQTDANGWVAPLQVDQQAGDAANAGGDPGQANEPDKPQGYDGF